MEKLTKYFDKLEYTNNGAFSEVLVARDLHTGKKVALKVSSVDDKRRYQIFKKEAKLLKYLKHPSICTLEKSFVLKTRGKKFGVLVLEKMEKDLLEYTLARGCIPEDEAKRIFQRVCGAVLHCHNHGVAHLDIKPDNVLLNQKRKIDAKSNNHSTCCSNDNNADLISQKPKNNIIEDDDDDDDSQSSELQFSSSNSGGCSNARLQPSSPSSPSSSSSSSSSPTSSSTSLESDDLEIKLCDFGYSRKWDIRSQPISKIQPGENIGTNDYLAPELKNIKRAKAFSLVKADCFSLGILLFSLLTGSLPAINKHGHPLKRSIKVVLSYSEDKSAYRLLRKMLHKDPASRPSIDQVLLHPWFFK